MLIFVIKSHWEYNGSHKYSDAYVKFKTDIFSGFKYYEIYPILGEGNATAETIPVYINNQTTMYDLALC
ncbi:hypothetical protein [Desulfurella sp.]|uniref:hypothetical protein n=1 Tax=Desulfurella sp. TaxID=1962857 RepID=UPI00257ABB58|nr:hypothetical protein [Desulfurella sp.]